MKMKLFGVVAIAMIFTGCGAQECETKDDCSDSGFCLNNKVVCSGPQPKTCTCVGGNTPFNFDPSSSECQKKKDCADLQCTNENIVCKNGVCTCPPGQGTFVLSCFTGDSLVKMKDGTFKPIRDVEIGDIVSRGGEVTGVMKYAGDTGLCRLGPNLVITPDHKIYHEGTFKMTSEAVDLASCTESAAFLYDLDTENHVIEFEGGIVATDSSEHDCTDPVIQKLELDMAQNLVKFAQ